MTRKTKGRDGGDRATHRTTDNADPTAKASRIEALIVALALWGLLPVNLADWTIRHLHLGAA